MKIRKNGKVVNLTESDLQRIVKKVISENQEDEPTDELLIVFKKYGEILESLVPNLDSLAKKANSGHLKSIVNNIMECVGEINNLNYDNIDDLENFILPIVQNAKQKWILILSQPHGLMSEDIFLKHLQI